MQDTRYVIPQSSKALRDERRRFEPLSTLSSRYWVSVEFSLDSAIIGGAFHSCTASVR